MNIIKQTSTNNTNYCPSRKIKYIVIHYTAGSTSRTGTAKNVASMFSRPGQGGSADFIVDDTQIVQFSPDVENYLCWHCGDNRTYNKGGSYYGRCTNANSIGIEICSTNSNYSPKDPANSPKWSFTSAAITRAVELTKYLMQKYKIPAENVIRHYDVSGKLCPGIIGWNAESGSEAKWIDFKKAISSTAASTVTPAATAKTNKPVNTPIYRVRKSANDSATQIGAYAVLANAKKQADAHAGYKVFDMSGKLVYDPAAKTAKTVEQLAREVISGKWGSGADRKKRLTAAGYDYAAVQARVNDLMR